MCGANMRPAPKGSFTAALASSSKCERVERAPVHGAACVALAAAERALARKAAVLRVSCSGFGDSGTIAIADLLANAPEGVATDIHMRGCDIGDAGACALAVALRKRTHGVRSLDLCENRIGAAGAAALAAALPDHRSLRSLLLCHNRIGDTGMYALGNQLAASGVTLLAVSDNGISYRGARALAAALGHALPLRPAGSLALVLDGNEIGDEGATAIAPLLAAGAVESLSLASCSIAERGAAALAAATTSTSSRCIDLELRGNAVGEGGAVEVARALRSGARLERLSLSACGVALRGARAIADALDRAPTLRTLDVGGNHLDDIAASAFAVALEHTTNLQVLGIGSDRITSAGVQRLTLAVRRNSSIADVLVGFACTASSSHLARLEIMLQANRREHLAPKCLLHRASDVAVGENPPAVVESAARYIGG